MGVPAIPDDIAADVAWAVAAASPQTDATVVVDLVEDGTGSWVVVDLALASAPLPTRDDRPPREPTRPDVERTTDGVVTEVLDDGLLLWSPAADGAVVAEGTAAFVWAGIVDGIQTNALVDELQEVWPDRDGIAGDVHQAVDRWCRAGFLDRGYTTAEPSEGSALSSPRVRWNPERRYDAGGCVRVRVPDEGFGKALDELIRPMSGSVDGPVLADVEVERRGDGFEIWSPNTASVHAVDAREALLPIRRRVLAEASRGEPLRMRGSAVRFAGANAAVVLLGSSRTRVAVLRAAIGTGATVVADDLVIVDQATVQPVGVGLAHRRTPSTVSTLSADAGVESLIDEFGWFTECTTFAAPFTDLDAWPVGLFAFISDDSEDPDGDRPDGQDWAIRSIEGVALARRLIGVAGALDAARARELATLVRTVPSIEVSANWAGAVVDALVEQTPEATGVNHRS